MRLFFRYLVIGALCSNFPFPLIGPFLGFGAIIATALVLTLLNSNLKSSRSIKVGYTSLFVGAACTVVWFVFYGLYFSVTEIGMLVFNLSVYAAPAVLLSSLIVALFHSRRQNGHS